MPEVELSDGTQWRIVKPQLGFIPALVLVALGWFWHRRNRIASAGRRLQPVFARVALGSLGSGGLVPPLPISFFDFILNSTPPNLPYSRGGTAAD